MSTYQRIRRGVTGGAVAAVVLLAGLPAAPASAGGGTGADVRFATFNASLNRGVAGQLRSDLSTPDNAQARTIAEIIQRARPDVLLINEFDYDPLAAVLFQDNYLSVGQNGARPIHYAHRFIAPSNTGVPSGFDLNNDGTVVTTPGAPGYGDDALGFGAFPGQFGMVVYSRFPIDRHDARTFQRFRWKDMPGALLPDDPATPAPADWYSPEELEVVRLSSKSHWDLPIEIGRRTVHFLVAHPTPPVFDGAEDRNGRRNFDEIGFWADYVTPRTRPLHLRRPGTARRPEARRVVRDRRRPELRPARRRQHPGRGPAAARQPPGRQRVRAVERGRGRGGGAAGRGQRDAPQRPALRHGRLRRRPRRATCAPTTCCPRGWGSTCAAAGCSGRSRPTRCSG